MPAPATLALARSTPAGATVALMFGLNSFLLAGFFARLPDVRASLGLDHGELGLALAGLSAGSVLAMLAAGRLAGGRGEAPGPATWWAGVALCLASPAPALASSGPTLAAALTLLGLANGAAAVAANAAAAALEARAGVPAMASFHAVFSLGGIVGAGAGGLAAAAGLAPAPQLLVAAIIGLLALLARRGTLGGEVEPLAAAAAAGPRGRFAAPRGRLAGLAAVCFATMLCEGAASDWSALYLAGALGAPPALAASGYACFAGGMALARLRVDALRARLGDAAPAAGGALLAAAGMGAGLLAGHPAAGVLGFACLGLGLAGVVPIALRAAAEAGGAGEGGAPAAGIAAVASVGFTGFLAGPPVIGLLAQHLAGGLGAALWLVPALSLLVALAAPRVLGAGRR